MFSCDITIIAHYGRHNLMTLHIETPLVRSDILSDLVNKDIRLKLDALQPSGSFKIRGIGYACEHLSLIHI